LDQKKTNITVDLIEIQRFFNIFFLILSISFLIFIPSKSSAEVHKISLKKESGFFMTSSLDTDKSEYFENELDKYIGTPYIKGGTTDKGFDCSGFVRQVYMEFFGIDLPHKSSSQSSLPYMQKVSKDELITGDLIFFSTKGKNKRINHVGIYLSDGRFIHAANGGVTISSLDSSYWKTRFFVAKRIGNNDIWNNIATNEIPETALQLMYNKYSNRFNLLDDLSVNSSYLNSYSYFSDFMRDSLSMGYEFTWSASIANGVITPQVTAFQEYYPYKSGQYNLLSSDQINDYSSITVSERSPNHGLHFATSIGNNEEGISLTPSFTYYDTGYDLENRRLQSYTYGLDLEISPNDRPWLLALGMKYSSYSYSHDTNTVNSLNEFRSPMNMSVTYVHKLNQSAYFSFTGEVIQRYEPASEGTAFDLWKNERRSMFLFNLNY
jgi:hypothetical protein